MDADETRGYLKGQAAVSRPKGRTIRTPTALPKCKSSLGHCWLSVDSLLQLYRRICPAGDAKKWALSQWAWKIEGDLTYDGRALVEADPLGGCRTGGYCFPLRNTLRQIRMANRIWCLRR